jgi:hypothetical protein
VPFFFFFSFLLINQLLHCREMDQTGKKLTTVLKDIKSPPSRLRSLKRYVNDGSKFTLLAGGGK